MTWLKRIISFFRYFFWTKPTGTPEPLKATEVLNHWIVIDYKGQFICLRDSELLMFDRLARKDKRAMAQKFEALEKKGRVRFEEINGKTVAIWNKDYEQQANIRKSRDAEIRRGERPAPHK